MASARALLGALALTTALLVLPVVAAHADGDPASDVLLAQNAFYPYQPPVAPSVENALSTALREIARTGVNLKVAIIGSALDLGADPRFFGYPQAYARYLDAEISFNGPQPLLVVMPVGFALASTGPTAALGGMRPDTAQGSYGLTRSAILAVVALAHARGHPIATPPIPPASAGGGSGVSTLLIFGIPAVLLILAGVATLRSGDSRKQEQPAPQPPAPSAD